MKSDGISETTYLLKYWWYLILLLSDVTFKFVFDDSIHCSMTCYSLDHCDTLLFIYCSLYSQMFSLLIWHCSGINYLHWCSPFIVGIVLFWIMQWLSTVVIPSVQAPDWLTYPFIWRYLPLQWQYDGSEYFWWLWKPRDAVGWCCSQSWADDGISSCYDVFNYTIDSTKVLPVFIGTLPLMLYSVVTFILLLLIHCDDPLHVRCHCCATMGDLFIDFDVDTGDDAVLLSCLLLRYTVLLCRCDWWWSYSILLFYWQ